LYIDEVLPYLPAQPGLAFFEAGCAPGGILADFCARRGYEAHGIDNAGGLPDVRRLLESRGIRVGGLHAGDFTTWTAPRTYDMVASFGFIEHFRDPWAVACRHFDIARPAGYVLLGVPNFGRGQRLLHWIFDRENLRRHNLSCMSVGFLAALAREKAARLLFARYTGGPCELWVEPGPRSAALKRWMDAVVRGIRGTARVLGGERNALFSPYLLALYRTSPGA